MTHTSSLAVQRQQLLGSLLALCEPNVEHPLQLVKKLYDISLPVVEAYLLQVAHVCITHPIAETHAALLDYMLCLAGESLQVALRLSWMVDALSPFFPAGEMPSEVKKINDKIESYAINQLKRRPPSSSGSTSASTEPHLDKEVSTSIDNVQLKELRLRIFTDQKRFIAHLTKLSEDLRSQTDRKLRKKMLKEKLERINESLGDLWVMHPLRKSDDPVLWIVRIVIEECTVFSSRERAPYLIRYEVLEDHSATMLDPSLTTLRVSNGDFRTVPDGDERYVPCSRPPLKRSPPSAAIEKGESGKGLSGRASALMRAPKSPSISDEDIQLNKTFGEPSEVLKKRIRENSPWGAHPNWEMKAVIIKAGDDLRQEELALQLIRFIHDVWEEQGIPCLCRPYSAYATHFDRGIIEFIHDSNSIDGIKKSSGHRQLDKFFHSAFGEPCSASFIRAQQNFAESMAAYSVISHLLRVKDRHNGNLMITRTGEVNHIDFGFFLATSPGWFTFESAPFKLSQELINVLGGLKSDTFNYYKTLVYLGAQSLQAYADEILALAILLMVHYSMPCFGSNPSLAVTQFRSRFNLEMRSSNDFALHIRNLIQMSADNWRTRQYDQFQTYQNDIL